MSMQFEDPPTNSDGDLVEEEDFEGAKLVLSTTDEEYVTNLDF